MRYYSIEIYNPGFKDGDKPFRRYASQSEQGVINPNALNMEMNIPVNNFSEPTGQGFARVWGVSLQEIAQGNELTGKSIRVYGGMQKGLPLANPAQAGLLFEGTIQNAFGNWIGTNQTLDMILSFLVASETAPANIVLPWRKGMQLADAIKTTLATAFPTYTCDININPNLVLPHDEPGYYQTVAQFAQYIKIVSQNIIGGSYQGVDIIVRQKKFIVYDGTSTTTPKQIAFTDLIGQPTWGQPGGMNLTCVMRADLNVGDFVKLPPGQITTTAAALSQFKNGSVFQGIYQIAGMRHLGNFRQANASAWVSVFDIFLSA